MSQQIAALALVVHDYDAAIAFYTEKVGFQLVKDIALGGGKRWVEVRPSGSSTGLILSKAKNERQSASIGNQTGGRVFLFMETTTFEEDYRRMLDNGIHFTETPREEVYGKVVVWEDLYGNKWDLIQRWETDRKVD